MRQTLIEGPDPLLGSKVAGRYTVMRKIAKGGMGVVYLAVQDGLNRTVALKIIRKEAALDPMMQKRFEREARAVSSLSHPAIVTVHDFGHTDDGSLFLAMEFVDGEVLREALKRKGRLTFAETVPIIEAIAGALARAHAAGVVHRDLKPENVILPRQSATTTGAVAAKVLDFGLAKPHDPDMQEENLTRDGGFVGTPGYAAPEQAEGQPEHPRQDLYALGVVWFELLKGAHPFPAETPMKVMVRQLHEEPPNLEGQLLDVPPAAATLIRALMARRPADRPPSAHAVLEELQRIKSTSATVVVPGPSDSQPDALTLAGATAVTPTPVVRPSRSGPMVLVTGALAAALIGATIVFVVSGGLEGRATVAADAGATVAVDNGDRGADNGGPHVGPPGEPARGVELVLQGIPTFSALQGVREALPTTVLEIYSRERSVLHIDQGSAGPLGEKLQGLALRAELPLVLEVKELSPGHLVLAAVRPEDASALADAGALLDGGSIADAGPLDVITGGGLAP